MAPLTKLVKVEHSQFKRQWGPEQDDAFEAVKAFISQVYKMLVFVDLFDL
jgi:hypothetical protein